MSKAKSKAKVMTADGSGGMRVVQDLRFEQGEWPIRFMVPEQQADTWWRYFYAETERRGWGSSSMAQMEAGENSGSVTVRTGGADGPSLAVVWERKRARAMLVRGRSAGTPEFPVGDAQEFFNQVNERCRSGAMERKYGRSQLLYEGLAWRGELWLSNTLRLGPPSRQYESALLGPRVILVDALVDCVGRADSSYVFDTKMRELSIFLSVVMGTAVQIPKHGRIWTWTLSGETAECAVRDIGYVEQNSVTEMPARGASPAMPLKHVNRPDFSLRGIDGTINEVSLPEDVSDLWAAFSALTAQDRRQFLQAGAKWQEALTHGPERSTLSFTLMVVACEILKPVGSKSRDHNIYNVVEGLLGKAVAEKLKEDWFRPQEVRNAHLHRGESYGVEFAQLEMMSSYYDPTFYQARRALAMVAQETLIEWLKRRGAYTMPASERRKTFRRWIKKYALILLPVLTALGVALGWFLRILWFR